MEVTSAYLYTTGDLPQMFAGIQKAQVPPKFTHGFLQALGFKSTNDRAFINVLKGLGFLDSNATPTKVYRDFRDPARAKGVLAQQIRVAYQGLFAVDDNAQNLTLEAVKGKLATVTGKDEAVIKKMAQTFKALCKEADFSKALSPEPENAFTVEEQVVESPALEKPPHPQRLAFSHCVYINLPTTRDVAVYDAIFKSIREHLL